MCELHLVIRPAGSAFRYPWAMAPTINTMKPVATAMVTFVSTDKFIIFPFNYGGNPRRPRFLIFSVDRFEFQRADGCLGAEEGRTRTSEGRKDRKAEGRIKNYEL
jgi:hypothetical protein